MTLVGHPFGEWPCRCTDTAAVVPMRPPRRCRLAACMGQGRRGPPNLACIGRDATGLCTQPRSHALCPLLCPAHQTPLKCGCKRSRWPTPFTVSSRAVRPPCGGARPACMCCWMPLVQPGSCAAAADDAGAATPAAAPAAAAAAGPRRALTSPPLAACPRARADGAIDCFKKTLQWEGVPGLYKGVTSPLAGQVRARRVQGGGRQRMLCCVEGLHR